MEKRSVHKENNEKEQPVWPVLIFLAIVGYAPYIGGWKLALAVFIIGVIILGWKDRHKGPFPTKK